MNNAKISVAQFELNYENDEHVYVASTKESLNLDGSEESFYLVADDGAEILVSRMKQDGRKDSEVAAFSAEQFGLTITVLLFIE